MTSEGVIPQALHAWVDESMRLSADDTGEYILAAATCDPAGADEARSALRSLPLPRQNRLHWHKEAGVRRNEIAAAMAAIDVTSLVVVGRPVVRARQERARRLCMEVLLPRLSAVGVRQVWFESRTQALNSGDVRMVSALRGKRLLPPALRVGQARPTEEPMLWAADVIAGAVNAALGGNREWLEPMSHRVEIIEIALR